MPIIESLYQAPNILFRNPHFATVYPSVFRKKPNITYTREQLDLWDGDFLDLDWSFAVKNEGSKSNSTLAILTHGLLGDTQRGYIKATAKVFNDNNWDVLAWNHRGLSGRPNRLERMTIHGSSDELAAIVKHAIDKGYQTIVLVGFSKGGNISLKYAGEQGNSIPSQVKSVVAVSVPCDVYDSLLKMGERGFYTNIFRDKLRKFLKNRQHLIDPKQYQEFSKYSTLAEYMNKYVSPLHGFANEKDYCVSVSCVHSMHNIRVPSLVLNAQDDPVLSVGCSPIHIARESAFVYLETPAHGGHCGFYESSHAPGVYWDAYRAFEFCMSFA
jgi:uncharacterized protein